jgi:hypothetical protein
MATCRRGRGRGRGSTILLDVRIGFALGNGNIIIFANAIVGNIFDRASVRGSLALPEERA